MKATGSKRRGPSVEERIIRTLEKGDYTSQEIAKKIGARPQTVATQLGRMKCKDVVIAAGKKASDDGGRSCTVWRLVDDEVINERLSERFMLFKPKEHSNNWLGVWF